MQLLNLYIYDILSNIDEKIAILTELNTTTTPVHQASVTDFANGRGSCGNFEFSQLYIDNCYRAIQIYIIISEIFLQKIGVNKVLVHYKASKTLLPSTDIQIQLLPYLYIRIILNM